MKNKRDKIWRALRALQTFTIPDVVTTSGIARVIVRDYVLALYRAGYVAKKGNKTFRLIRDTGPKAPVPLRVIYDPNEDRYY